MIVGLQGKEVFESLTYNYLHVVIDNIQTLSMP